MFDCTNCTYTTTSDREASDHARENRHCVAQGDGVCNAYCYRWDH